MKVVLMAGGKGTRISELFPNIPKPLIPIEDVPVLEREIISLRDQGFKDIILTIGYMADKIKNYFGDGSKWGVNISYFVEEKPLGNAGALFFLNIEDDFLLLNKERDLDDFGRLLDVTWRLKKGTGDAVSTNESVINRNYELVMEYHTWSKRYEFVKKGFEESICKID